MHSSDCLKIQLSLSNNFLTIIAFNSMLKINNDYSLQYFEASLRFGNGFVHL